MSPLDYTSLKQKIDSKTLPRHTVEPPRPFQRRWIVLLKSFWRKSANTISLIVAVLCVAIFAGFLASKTFLWSLRMTDQSKLLSEAFFPNFGEVSVTFVNGGDFIRYDSYGDALWDGLVPLGAGYVRVPNPRELGLPPSEVLEDNGSGYAEMFQASVVHQLHCMGILRNYTRAYEAGIPPPKGGHMHVRHCIEYIRQAILCTADTTLEQANAEGAFNAEGAIHQCRDWNLVKAFLEDNRVDDALPGILDT